MGLVIISRLSSRILIVAALFFDDISDRVINKLLALQNRAARIITVAHYLTPTDQLLNKLG